MEGVEAFTAEAAEASGAAALNLAVKALKSGYVDSALVVGVEKYTDMVGSQMDNIIAMSNDTDFESMQGMNLASSAALVMQRYLFDYQPPRDAFGTFSIISHANAVHNPNALYRRAIHLEDYQKAGLVCDPLNLLDAAPFADGAAAVLLTRRELLPEGFSHAQVKVSASSLVTDMLALHDRTDPLAFDAARISAERAFAQAGIPRERVDLFEYWDAFSIYAVMCLETAGYAERGAGWKLGGDGSLELHGRLPVATMGGLKARGFPLGAAGIYQVVDAVSQLRGAAGENQIQGARCALVQSLGGPAATAVTHILQTL